MNVSFKGAIITTPEDLQRLDESGPRVLLRRVKETSLIHIANK